MEELSKTRQQIAALNKRRAMLLNKIMNTEPFIAAQVYERYKKYGNKNCKCAKGELHGPFTWIYQKKKDQKLISTTIKKDIAPEALELAGNYKSLQDLRKQVREIDDQINLLINTIEKILEQDVTKYVAKKEKTERRPKQD